MGEFFDRLAEWLNFDAFLNMFRDNEEFIMTRGIRIMAVGCLIIAIAYGVIAYIQFSRL